MTSQNTDQERAEFEAWSQANDKYHVSGYNPHNDLWEAWQAARSAPAAPEPHGWKLVPIEPTEAQLWCLYGRFVGQLTTEAKLYSDMLAAAPQPQGWKLVPVNLLERIQESLGSFVSDQGWSQSDMDTADALDGVLARDLVEDTDPDDEAFDDFAEDVDESECHNCSGTGEGMYDSQSCVVCLGKGFL